MEIDTKKGETRLTNPERQMKHRNRLSLFLTDSYWKIIDFQKIEEELGCTLVRGKAYNSATWPFSEFPDHFLQFNLKQSATLLKYLVPGLQLELTSII